MSNATPTTAGDITALLAANNNDALCLTHVLLFARKDGRNMKRDMPHLLETVGLKLDSKRATTTYIAQMDTDGKTRMLMTV